MFFKMKHHIICALIIGYLCSSAFSTTDAFDNATNSEDSFSNSTNSEESSSNATNLIASPGKATNSAALSWNSYPFVIQNGTEAKVEHGIKSKLKDTYNKLKDKAKEIKDKVKDKYKEIKNKITGNREKDKSKDIGTNYNKIGNKEKDKSKDIGTNYNKIGNKDTSGIRNKGNNNKIRNKDTSNNGKYRDRYRRPDTYTSGGGSSSNSDPTIVWITLGIIGVSALFVGLYFYVKNN